MHNERNGRRRTPGLTPHHSRKCASRQGRNCNCQPSWEAWVYSAKEQRKIRAPHLFPTFAAAKSWRVDAMAANQKGTLRPPAKQTLRQAWEAWEEAAVRGEILARGNKRYKPSPLRSYSAAMRLRALPKLGDFRLSELATADVQRFVNRMIADGIDASTIRNTVNPLRAVYRHAVAVGDVAFNPTIGLQLPSVEGKRDRIASPAEASKLIAVLPDDDQALWTTAFYAGLRRGELRALRCRNVDIAAGLIRVEAGWDDVEGPIDPKSRKGARNVPIPSVLRRHLAAHLLRTGRSGNDFVFGRTATTSFSPALVRRRALRAWAAAAAGAFISRQPLDIEVIGLHECRHTYVTLMFEAGNSLERIGDYVGHSSTYMTDRYRHLLPGSEAEAAAKLDSYLERSVGG
ncbi:MAG TPA: tyrosine-type recombinase/integrase [Gaiellaceae bacterium]